ncbi:MAG TPA: DUF5683 domain-containing protein [Cytophagaceae bacterium]
MAKQFFYLLLILLLLPYHKLFSQTDTLFYADPDSGTVLSKTPHTPIPKRAALYSAVLPGLGQAYNRQLWKVPVIYAGIGTLTYFIISNRQEYLIYRDALRFAADTIPGNEMPQFANASIDFLRVNRDYYRRNLELCIILSSALYALNIVDAYVYAHLKGFDVGGDIALKVKPFLFHRNNTELATGLTLNISFKK